MPAVVATRPARSRGWRWFAPPADAATTAESAKPLLEPLELIALNRQLLDVAAGLPGDHLRSLDAIHVAAALSLGTDLTELITYDRRMVAAAEHLGLPVTSPA